MIKKVKIYSLRINKDTIDKLKQLNKNTEEIKKGKNR